MAALAASGIDATADSLGLTIHGDVDSGRIRSAAGSGIGAAPDISDDALDGLKFSAALPRHIAAAVLAERITDPVAAASVARAPMRVARG